MQTATTRKQELEKQIANEQVQEREINDNVQLRECRRSIQSRAEQEASIRAQLERE
jgi:hypothetical protein